MSGFMHVHIVALRYFSQTVRCGSMRQAAEALSISASAVNRQILKLEGQLDAKLFERFAEGVRLTAAGEVLYRHVLRLERDLDQTVSEITDLRGLRRGRVTLASEDGITRDVLAPMLARFHRLHPGITYSIEVLRADAVTGAVLDGAADIGLAMFPPERERLSIVAEVRLPMGVVTAVDHPLASKPFAKPTDLVHEPLVQMKEGIGGDPDLHPLLDRWTSGRSLVETNTSDGMTSLVKAGIGVGVRTPIGIMREIATREIAFVPLRDGGERQGRLVCFTKAQRALPNAAALLVEHVRHGLKEVEAAVEPLFGRPAPARERLAAVPP